MLAAQWAVPKVESSVAHWAESMVAWSERQRAVKRAVTKAAHLAVCSAVSLVVNSVAWTAD